MDREYQPKGGMCMKCNNRDKDCSDLNFKEMKVIKEEVDVFIVKCKEFKNEN